MFGSFLSPVGPLWWYIFVSMEVHGRPMQTYCFIFTNYTQKECVLLSRERERERERKVGGAMSDGGRTPAVTSQPVDGGLTHVLRRWRGFVLLTVL